MSDEHHNPATDEPNNREPSQSEPRSTPGTDTESSSPTDGTDAGVSSTPASTGAVRSEPGGSGSGVAPTDDRTGAGESGFDSAMDRYLFWGAFGLLSILAVVATAGLYTSVSSAIDVWVASDYEPIVRALFNLVVVLTCALGLSVLLRRIDVSEST